MSNPDKMQRTAEHNDRLARTRKLADEINNTPGDAERTAQSYQSVTSQPTKPTEAESK